MKNLKHIKNEEGILAMVVAFSIAAFTGALLLWMQVDQTQLHYKKLKTANEMKLVNQLVLSVAKAELMRRPVRPLIGDFNQFRNLLLLAQNVAPIPAIDQQTLTLQNRNCNGYSYSVTNWAMNILCLSGVPLSFESIGSITLRVEAKTDANASGTSRGITIQVASTSRSTGNLASNEVISKNFSLNLAVGNQYGVVLSDGSQPAITINLTNIPNLDSKSILLGRAPGVVFDSKVLVNSTSDTFDYQRIDPGMVVYSHLSTNASAVGIDHTANLWQVKNTFPNGIETRVFHQATSGVSFLNGLFDSSSAPQGLNENIQYANWLDTNAKVFPVDPSGSFQAKDVACGPLPGLMNSLGGNFFGRGINRLDETCKAGQVIVVQDYGSGAIMDIVFGNDILGRSTYSNIFCGLITTDTLNITLPRFTPNPSPRTFAIVGNIIAKKININFQGCGSGCDQRLFFINPFDQHELPVGVQFPEATQSMASMSGDITNRSGTITRRFLSPSLIQGASSELLDRYQRVHSFPNGSVSGSTAFLPSLSEQCGPRGRTYTGTTIFPLVSTSAHPLYNYQFETQLNGESLGFDVEEAK